MARCCHSFSQKLGTNHSNQLVELTAVAYFAISSIKTKKKINSIVLRTSKRSREDNSRQEETRGVIKMGVYPLPDRLGINRRMHYTGRCTLRLAVLTDCPFYCHTLPYTYGYMPVTLQTLSASRSRKYERITCRVANRNYRACSLTAY